MKTREEFFLDYLQYHSIAHSLWRCCECARFSKEVLKKPVLDVGCGDGFFAQLVFGHVDVGVDLEQMEVRKAIIRGTYDWNIVADVTKLPFEDGFFSTIISNCVIEHIPNVEAALLELYRVLKPGGRLIITVPSEQFNNNTFYQRVFNAIGFNQTAQWYNRSLNKIFKHYHVNNLITWKRWFEQSGFMLETAEYIVEIKIFHAFEKLLLPAMISKLWKKLFNRWVLWPRYWLSRVAQNWFRQLLMESDLKGACYFFVVKKGENQVEFRG